MASQDFDKGLGFVLRWEGSEFTNAPDDRGGATRYGVTQRVYDGFRQRQGRPVQSVEHISEAEVHSIYRQLYWNAVQGDAAPWPVDVVLFDTGVLMGVGRAAEMLQSALGVAVDGVIGPHTLAALASGNPAHMAADVLQLREHRLRAIVAADSSQQKWLQGWLNRLDDLKRFISGAEASPSKESGSPTQAKQAPGNAGGMSIVEFLSAAKDLTAVVGPIFSVDVGGSNVDCLRLGHPLGGDRFFDCPGAAIATLTLIGLQDGGTGRPLAAVTFAVGFEGLANVRGLLQRPETGR